MIQGKILLSLFPKYLTKYSSMTYFFLRWIEKQLLSFTKCVSKPESLSGLSVLLVFLFGLSGYLPVVTAVLQSSTARQLIRFTVAQVSDQ